MDANTDKRPKLALIRGGYPSKMSLGSVSIIAAPKDRPPFQVDAVAAEEDTFLVLSADPEVRDPGEPMVRVMTRVIEMRPATPGSVLMRGGDPMRLLAIVHDLNQEPSWREEWVASALDRIFQVAESRRLSSIALPSLGTLYGSLEKRRFVVLLWNALERISTVNLKRIWLVVPDRTSSDILEILESQSGR
jgi:hypothetical protein